MKTIAPLALEIVQLKEKIKQLQEQVKEKTDRVSTLIALGELDGYATEDDAYQVGFIRIKPVQTRRWSYDPTVKQEIAVIQEQAQLSGKAKEVVSVSYRLSENTHELKRLNGGII
jgi:cell division septum initiation protein DivIVA